MSSKLLMDEFWFCLRPKGHKGRHLHAFVAGVNREPCLALIPIPPVKVPA